MALDLQELLSLITKGSEHLATLCRLCDDEKSAIEQQSPQQLQEVVNLKRDALQALAENTDSRNRCLLSLGVTADQAGIEQLIKSAPPSSQLQQAWQQLCENLQQAQQLNQRNEQIVARNQKNLDQLLSILRGQSARTTLYDQAGLKNYRARSTLGKA